MGINIGNVDYNQAIEAVSNFYQTDAANVIKVINDYNLSPQQLYDLLPTIDKIWDTTYSNSGAVLGTDTISNIQFVGNDITSQAASVIDSNVSTASQATKSYTRIPAQSTIDSQTDHVTMSRGAKSVATGNTFLSIADKISLGVVGVSVGAKLGAFIDSAIYNVAPDYWDEVFPTINPQTWDTIATSSGGKQFIRGLFGISGNKSGMYIPENVFAYYALAMAHEGFFKSEVQANISDLSLLYNPTYFNLPLKSTNPIIQYSDRYVSNKTETYAISDSTSTVYSLCVTLTNNLVKGCFVSKNPFSVQIYRNGTYYTTVNGTYQSAKDGEYYYVITLPSYAANPVVHSSNANNYLNANDVTNNTLADIATIFFKGNLIIDSKEGVNPQPNATYPDINPDSGISDVLAQLKSLYPDLWDKAISEDVTQPDGTTKTYTYVPLPVTNTDNLRETSPTNTTVTQDDYIVDPAITSQDLLNTFTRYLTGTQLTLNGGNVPLDPTENPPATGDGNTPNIVLPTGSANALYSIYNPSQSELNSFGSWLWSSNFVDQLLKLFNDPMQAIIGLHKIYATPTISGIGSIKVGYLNSGVSSNIVGSQYTTIDCGQISILEYFGNVFDYDPFTCVYIYLPFIGIEKLDTGDVMRGQLNVVYHVDVLTGACLAEIRVIRDISGGTLYTFTGNCAVQYPISGGSYMGIVTSIASIAGGVVGTVSSGGALAPVVMGTVSGALNAHAHVQHSGTFSGNAGAMGIKTPYIIITRPQTCLSDNFPAYEGYPSNDFTKLSSCSGYVKVKSCHITNVPATDSELSEIESLLKSGIII